MGAAEKHEGGSAEAPARRSWRRVVAVLAVVASVAANLLGMALAFAIAGVNETPSSPLHLWTNAAAISSFALPPAIVITVVLATIAGTEGGRSRRLGVLAGLLAILSLVLFFVTGTLLPFRY